MLEETIKALFSQLDEFKETEKEISKIYKDEISINRIASNMACGINGFNNVARAMGHILEYNTKCKIESIIFNQILDAIHDDIIPTNRYEEVSINNRLYTIYFPTRELKVAYAKGITAITARYCCKETIDFGNTECSDTFSLNHFEISEMIEFAKDIIKDLYNL